MFYCIILIEFPSPNELGALIYYFGWEHINVKWKALDTFSFLFQNKNKLITYVWED